MHYGKPSRSAYHNSEWASKMCEIGLIPSDTGKPGGKQTGQRMSHYIEEGGRFSLNCTDLMAEGFVVPYVELWNESKVTKSKAKNKTKFTCGLCGAAVWGKPELKIICAGCNEVLLLAVGWARSTKSAFGFSDRKSKNAA